MPGEKSTAFSGQLLGLIFNGTTIASIAQNATSSPYTNFYVSFHTADPGAGGNQTTNEVSYTSYARTAVPRSTGGFAVSGATVTFASNVIAPTPTGSATQTATNFAIGTASTGAGEILYTGPINPPITITIGQPPTLTTATTITEG